MSAERKKLLWISLSACVFVLVLAATGLYLFAPKKGGSSAPATAGNIAVPKAADPQDFLFSPPAAPSFEEPRSPGDDLVIVYGDRPNGGLVPADGSAATAATATAATAAAATAPVMATAPRSTDAIPPKAAPAAKPASTKTTTATSAAPKPAAPVAKPAPVAKSAPVAKPAPVAKQAPKTKTEYWIQVASFSSRGRADELKDTIAAKQVAALISVKDLDGKSYYRVRIGPYSAKAEADGWIEKIKSIPGCESAMVMQTTVEVKN
ncbi:MAG: SPOR domain-containing protein [Spirochaetaceae bacterium]|nr:SPOR domain-containing protein [Spirochaetaceae bacterium]